MNSKEARGEGGGGSDREKNRRAGGQMGGCGPEALMEPRLRLLRIAGVHLSACEL